ncbi:unnamed protein product [Timema podura]|uniref:Uncharacterized protein n=1 Tax=Timema podura TaxID=61482 RepID=A0ABN7NW65_TIMPD|nr:unnamed protein product [Timema podura]
MATLQIIARGTNEKPAMRYRASGLLNSLNSLETCFLTLLWKDVLERFNRVRKSLQSVNIKLINQVKGNEVEVSGRKRFGVTIFNVIIDRLVTELQRRCSPYGNDKLFRTMADLVVSEGYAAVGYEYINIDDCWLEKERNFRGELQPDKQRFPYGLRDLSNFLTSVLSLFPGDYQERACKSRFRRTNSIPILHVLNQLPKHLHLRRRTWIRTRPDRFLVPKDDVIGNKIANNAELACSSQMETRSKNSVKTFIRVFFLLTSTTGTQPTPYMPHIPHMARPPALHPHGSDNPAPY